MLKRLLLLLIVLAGISRADQPLKIVVISIDGMRPEFYLDPVKWDAPNLQRIRRQGAWAERSLSVFPTVTYVNHTSMITGRYPAFHGINANTSFDAQHGPQPGWNWEARLIQVPTLWDEAHKSGLTSAAFSWPVTTGAPIDWLVPEIFHVDGADNETTEQLIRERSTPGLIDAIQKESGRTSFPADFPAWDAWLADAAGYVWRHDHPRLTFIHMLNADWIQHRAGPESAEFHQALKGLDASFGKLVAEIDPKQTLLIVLGDHGFRSFTHLLAPNRLFVDQGWIDLVGGEVQSWQVIAHTNGGSCGIYCQNPALAPKVLDLLEANASGRYQVLRRDRLDELKTYPGALCSLVAEPGYALRGNYGKPFEESIPVALGQHGYLPESVPTGMLAWGRGVKPGKDLGVVHVIDLAPTICNLLGLDYSAMTGQALNFGP